MRVFNNKHIGHRTLYVALLAFLKIYNIGNRPNIHQYSYILNIERLYTYVLYDKAMQKCARNDIELATWRVICSVASVSNR